MWNILLLLGNRGNTDFDRVNAWQSFNTCLFSSITNNSLLFLQGMPGAILVYIGHNWSTLLFFLNCGTLFDATDSRFSSLHRLLSVHRLGILHAYFLHGLLVPPSDVGLDFFWMLALSLFWKAFPHLHPQRKSPQPGRPISGNTAFLLLPAEPQSYQGSAAPGAGITSPSLCEPSSHRSWEGCWGIACDSSVLLSLVILGFLPSSKQQRRL